MIKEAIIVKHALFCLKTFNHLTFSILTFDKITYTSSILTVRISFQYNTSNIVHLWIKPSLCKEEQNLQILSTKHHYQYHQQIRPYMMSTVEHATIT